MKKLEIVFLIITGLIVIGFTVGIYVTNVDRDSEQFLAKYPMVITNQIPPTYLQLFSDSAKAKLEAINTFNQKLKFPVANIAYDSTYCIQVYKLSSTYGLSLNGGIIESNADGHRPLKTHYTANQESLLAIMDKVGELDTPSHIYFSLQGNNRQQILRNDSTAYYYATYHSVSVKYSSNGLQQICADAKDSHKDPMPVEILFLKRKHDLYFIVMSANQKRIPLKPGLLYGLIGKG